MNGVDPVSQRGFSSMEMTRAYRLILVLIACASCSSGGGGGGGAGDDEGAGGDTAGGEPDSGPAGDGDGSGPVDQTLPPDPLAAGHGIVGYWGQNGYGGANPADMSRWEPSLGEICATPYYDIIVLAFMTSFVSDRNGGMPETNFSFHCETPIDADHPFLLRCPEIEADIATCHAAGKKVLISLGGASGAYGFSDDVQAEQFAHTVWDMFLGGSGTLRPFGARSLDGVDLDIEGGGTNGYSAFVRRLRRLMDGAGDGWLITAAPQCPYPDAYLGPAPGTALRDAASAFDYLFVQFYNNFCNGASRAPFQDAFGRWSRLSTGSGPRIVVGLPAAPAAAPAGGYVEPDKLPSLINAVDGNASFAGVMLWDVSFDRQSGDPAYGAVAEQALR